MTTITVIKHQKMTDRIFATVITDWPPNGIMTAYFQVYKIDGYMKEDYPCSTSMVLTERWSSEAGAEESMRRWISDNTNADGTYNGFGFQLK